GAYTADYPLLRFARHTPDATTLRLAQGLGHTSAGQTIALPVAGLTNVAALPVEFVLYPAYPNPFNPETTLSLFVPALEAEQPIRLRIFDLLGQPVRTLIDESRSAGHHAITWHGRDDEGRSVGAGVYLIELVTPTSRFVHKTLYLK
ncbi:MAG: T9SS type A sorting domain-containing protein, partial [Gemmatimonadetes bacterium]|nr:T9SS type A sorting domain-containing protein [Gemmatimonadota bacterium]